MDRAREEAEMWAWLAASPARRPLDQCTGCSGLQQAEEERKKRFLSLSCEAYCGGLITEIDRPRSVSVSPNNHASNAYQDSHLWNVECGSINNGEALDTSLLPHRRGRHTVTSRAGTEGPLRFHNHGLEPSAG